MPPDEHISIAQRSFVYCDQGQYRFWLQYRQGIGYLWVLYRRDQFNLIRVVGGLAPTYFKANADGLSALEFYAKASDHA